MVSFTLRRLCVSDADRKTATTRMPEATAESKPGLARRDPSVRRSDAHSASAKIRVNPQESAVAKQRVEFGKARSSLTRAPQESGERSLYEDT